MARNLIYCFLSDNRVHKVFATSKFLAKSKFSNIHSAILTSNPMTLYYCFSRSANLSLFHFLFVIFALTCDWLIFNHRGYKAPIFTTIIIVGLIKSTHPEHSLLKRWQKCFLTHQLSRKLDLIRNFKVIGYEGFIQFFNRCSHSIITIEVYACSCNERAQFRNRITMMKYNFSYRTHQLTKVYTSVCGSWILSIPVEI